MSKDFEQISIKPGFMKHNGGVLFRSISETEYEFKSIVNENHLNAAGITHGGYLSALIDAGSGTAAHRAAENILGKALNLIEQTKQDIKDLEYVSGRIDTKNLDLTIGKNIQTIKDLLMKVEKLIYASS